MVGSAGMEERKAVKGGEKRKGIEEAQSQDLL